jgi:hypothetical protein
MLAKRTMWALLAAAAIGSAAADQATVRGVGPDSTPAAKRDNGLGALPHYREWREPWVYATPAESIDSGLGNLPPLSEWREPWLYAIPAESIDNGLGTLPPFSGRESWLRPTDTDSLDDGRPRPPARGATVGNAVRRAQGG